VTTPAPFSHPAMPAALKTGSPRLAERVLLALGSDPDFITDLLGDLSEEYADRAASNGVWAARSWCACEVMRSTPHLVWNAIRHGTPSTRARLFASMLAIVVTLSLLTLAWLTRNGPPARMVVGAGIDSDGVVVNNVEPVQLSLRVLDAAGHRLERTDVRFQRMSGAPVPVSRRGVIKCTQRGDAVVRASLATIQRDFVIHCQPVHTIRGLEWGNFMVGEPARTLALDAIGLDKQPVTRIAARLRVVDSTVATLTDGGQLRPLRPGFTPIEVQIGDNFADAGVTVFEQVRSFDGLRPDQRWVVAPIRLARGESLRFPLPAGLFFLAFGADSSNVPMTRGFSSGRLAQSPVTMSVAGPIMCMPELGPGVLDTHCLARALGATLTLTRSRAEGAAEIVGTLALERQEQR
jgi:hypothetical protein